MRFGLPYPDPSTSSSSSLIIILQSMRFGLPYSDPSTSSSSSLNPSIYAVWFTLSWSFIYSEDIFKSITYLRILNLKCPVHRNRIYREELKESLGMKGSSKCTNHVNVHKLYAVEYINTVCSLDYSFQFRNF